MNRIALLPLSWAVCVSLSLSPAMAADPYAPVEKTFANGMRALFVPRPAAGSVLVAVSVAAGGQDEPADRAGQSHFLEHLLFDGYDALDERAITEGFARRAAYVNAFTRDQSTIYFVLAPRAEAAAAASMLAGMLSRSTIPVAAFEKERNVILEELAKDAANPVSAGEQALQRLMWEGTPWALGSGGTPDTVRNASREEVLRYWQTYYRPDRMRVIVAGDAPMAELEAIVAPLRALPRGKGTVAARQDPRSWRGWGTWRARTVVADEASWSVVIALPAEVSGLHAELLARWLSQPSGPLSDLALEIGAERLPRDPADLLALRLTPAKTEAPAAILSALLTRLQALAQTGPSAAETERLLAAWRRETVLARQRLHYVAVLEGEALASSRAPLNELFAPAEPSAAALAQAAKRAFDNLAPRVRAVWSGPDAGDGAPQPLPAIPPAPAAAVVRAPSGPIVLPNGMTLAISQEPGNEVFGITLLVADRAAREPAGMRGVSDLLQRLIGKGSALSEEAQFARRLADAGLELKTADSPGIPFDDYYNLPEHAYLRLEGPALSFDAALQLLAEAIKTPRWNEAAWRSALASFKQARTASATGTSAASAALKRRVLGPTHPSIGPVAGTAADKEPTLDEVRALLGQWPEGWFAPPHLVLAVVSPRSVDEVTAAIEALFGDAPAHPAERLAPPPPPATLAPAEPLSKDAPQITLAWGHAAAVPEADAPALLLALTALSDRMTAEIREKGGMAYRLGAGARALPGGSWWIEANVGTRPDNRGAVESLMTQLLTQLGSELPNAESITRWAASSRRQEMLDRLAAISRAAHLARVTLDGSGCPLSVSAERLATVTPEQLREAARRYLAPQTMIPAY